MPEPKQQIITAESIRKLTLGHTLSLVEPIPSSLAIRDITDTATDRKKKAYWRFHKAVGRLRKETGHEFDLIVRIIWDDSHGLAVLTTVTRTR